MYDSWSDYLNEPVSFPSAASFFLMLSLVLPTSSVSLSSSSSSSRNLLSHFNELLRGVAMLQRPSSGYHVMHDCFTKEKEAHSCDSSSLSPLSAAVLLVLERVNRSIPHSSRVANHAVPPAVEALRPYNRLKKKAQPFLYWTNRRRHAARHVTWNNALSQ